MNQVTIFGQAGARQASIAEHHGQPFSNLTARSGGNLWTNINANISVITILRWCGSQPEHEQQAANHGEADQCEAIDAGEHVCFPLHCSREKPDSAR